MRSFLKNAAVASAILASFLPMFASAQTSDAVALTITPPFFTLNVNPGDAWASSIRAVNTNPSDLEVRATVMGFAPSDEAGHGTFIDASVFANDPDALANWIIVSSPSVIIPRGGAAEIPFSIIVPKNAAPGGHYGAILVGTAPPTGISGSHVGVSSFISALIFVRVSGDVKEQGSIREFSADKPYYQDPNIQFALRFANEGNVDVRPQGEIEIYNIFGKERGKVDVNQSGNLGYVLPSSTRRFDLVWQGGASLWDIGQYTAVVTLSYGANSKKSVSQTVTFWILPIWSMAEVLFGGLFAGAAIVFVLRRLIRRMLARELSYYKVPPPKAPKHDTIESERKASGVVDLRKWKDR